MGSGQGWAVDGRDPPQARGCALASPWVPQSREGRTAPTAWWGSHGAGGPGGKVGSPSPSPETGAVTCQAGQGLPPFRSSGGPGHQGAALPPASALPRTLQMGLSAAK